MFGNDVLPRVKPILAVIALTALTTLAARADVLRLTYDLDGTRFDIRGTPFGLGDGSFPVGPGTLVIEYPLSGDAIVDGPVRLLAYALELNFTSGSAGVEVTSDLSTSANFSGVQTFAAGTLSGGVITWTQSFPYKAQGTNTCNGAFCGFAGFTDGVPQQIDSEDPFTLGAFTFSAGGPQTLSSFVAAEVSVPGSSSASTFLLLRGQEISRLRIDTTPPEITLFGDETVFLDCGDSFDDPGAEASDNVSISQPVVVGGAVDSLTPGTYEITYDASDDAGNAAVRRTRVVIVADNCPVEEGEGVPEGFVEGALEGSIEGAPVEGEGSSEGFIEGASEGSEEGAPFEGELPIEGEGAVEAESPGEGEGLSEGETPMEGELPVEGEGALEGEGAAEGEPVTEGEGEIAFEGEGALEGMEEGAIEGEPLPEGEGELEGSIEGGIDGEFPLEGELEGEAEGIVEGSVEGDIEGVVEGEPEGELRPHSADVDGDGVFSLAE
ncbi:MAG: uncharacterized protein RLZZ303_1784, partial [Candidatus Hydrogenedentota bacterium]